MNTLKDLIFRYCVLFGKRFSVKQKIGFLRVLTKELVQLGYNVDVKLAKLQLTKRQHQNYFNAYIGDIDNADVIVCTHYDTGINSFGLFKSFAFNHTFNKTRYFVGLLPLLVLFLLSMFLNYFIFIPDIQFKGFFSVSGVSSVLSTVLLFYFIFKYKNGIPNAKNFVCNTSSIVTIINLIKKINKKDRKKIAFVLLDAGCTNQYGLKMLESYSDKVANKKFIFLDSIGNSEQLLFLKPQTSNCNIDDITFHEGQLETSFKDYMMVTAGQLESNNQVLLEHAYTRKDNILSIDVVEKHTGSLYKVIQSLLTK